MTIQDAGVLVGHLTSGGRVEQALVAYEEDRKRRDEAVVQKSRWMGKVSKMHSPIATWLGTSSGKSGSATPRTLKKSICVHRPF